MFKSHHSPGKLFDARILLVVCFNIPDMFVKMISLQMKLPKIHYRHVDEYTSGILEMHEKMTFMTSLVHYAN